MTCKRSMPEPDNDSTAKCEAIMGIAPVKLRGQGLATRDEHSRQALISLHLLHLNAARPRHPETEGHAVQYLDKIVVPRTVGLLEISNDG
jgi:hypothetical protein